MATFRVKFAFCLPDTLDIIDEPETSNLSPIARTIELGECRIDKGCDISVELATSFLFQLDFDKYID